MIRVFAILSLTLAIAVTLATSAHAKRYGSKICDAPEYTCYTAKSGDSWAKLFPNEEERVTVMKVNRMNTRLHKGVQIAIPRSFGESFMDHAPFPQYGDATGNRYIVVSLSKLAFGAYDEGGELQLWGPISGGKNYCANIKRGCRTPAGQFAVYRKGGSGCKSSKYPLGKGGAPMPYCMFIYKGYALHGSPTVPGYHDSHGCVRMYPEDAKWLSKTFTNGVSKVPVIIKE